ncbi:MAG: hypothetical protein ACYCXY_13270, partial [Acidimicrobiales bacterium]
RITALAGELPDALAVPTDVTVASQLQALVSQARSPLLPPSPRSASTAPRGPHAIVNQGASGGYSRWCRARAGRLRATSRAGRVRE